MFVWFWRNVGIFYRWQGQGTPNRHCRRLPYALSLIWFCSKNRSIDWFSAWDPVSRLLPSAVDNRYRCLSAVSYQTYTQKGLLNSVSIISTTSSDLICKETKQSQLPVKSIFLCSKYRLRVIQGNGSWYLNTGSLCGVTGMRCDLSEQSTAMHML